MSLGPISFLFAMPMVLVAVVIVAVVIRMSRNPGRQPLAPGSPAATGNGQWNAHVRRDGHLDPLAGFGVLTLSGGMLSFAPDDEPGGGWSYPSVSFGVSSNAMVANSDIALDSQATGRLQLTVSHERINRLSRNTFKNFRERDTSGEFVQAMGAAGATVLG